MTQTRWPSVAEIQTELQLRRQGPVVRYAEVLAQHHLRLAEEHLAFASTKMLSGECEAAGYFARCAAQRVRSARLLRERGRAFSEEHDQWCLKQAAKTYNRQ